SAPPDSRNHASRRASLSHASKSSCFQLPRSCDPLTDPFAPAPLRAFLALTSRSAPVLRIGTLASRFSPLGLLPSHQSDCFLQFRATACMRFTPPLRRSPSAQSSGTPRTCPRRTRRSWFRRLLSFLTTRLRRVHFRSSLVCSPAR